MTTLTRDDFRLFIDGTATPIEIFSTRAQALAIAVLFNTWTNGEVLERYRAIGRAFVNALEPSDRATIGSFSHEIAISPFVTQDRDLLNRALAEELWHGWGNPLGTAVDRAVTALADQGGKRVVLVVGPDRHSHCLAHQPCIGVDSATARARSSEISVYGVRVQTADAVPNSGDGAARAMAFRTGGGYLRLQPADNLTEVMSALMRELRHEYVLGFRPPVQDGRSHRVEVRAIEGSTVWSRKSYSADSR